MAQVGYLGPPARTGMQLAPWWENINPSDPYGTYSQVNGAPFQGNWGQRLSSYMTPGGAEADFFANQDATYQAQHLLNAMGLAQGGGGNPFREFLAKQASRYSLLGDTLQMGQESAPSLADLMGRQYVAGFGGQPRGLANDLYQQALARLNEIANGSIWLGTGDNATSGAKQVAMLAAALNNRYSGSYRNIMYDRIQRAYNQYMHDTQANPQGTESNFFGYARRIGLLPGGTAGGGMTTASVPGVPGPAGGEPSTGPITWPEPGTGAGDPNSMPGTPTMIPPYNGPLPGTPTTIPPYNEPFTPERTPAPAPVPTDYWTAGGAGGIGTADWGGPSGGMTEEQRQAELARRSGGGWADTWARAA